MTIQVETKDCTALSDAELSEMADICADGPAGYDVGLLSKQREEWVLNSQARESGKLLGFSFCTLERIGGTPCVLIGLASVKRNGKREQVLKAIVNDQLRRAWLAFPDEDVLVGTRLLDPAGDNATSIMWGRRPNQRRRSPLVKRVAPLRSSRHAATASSSGRSWSAPRHANRQAKPDGVRLTAGPASGCTSATDGRSPSSVQ